MPPHFSQRRPCQFPVPEHGVAHGSSSHPSYLYPMVPNGHNDSRYCTHADRHSLSGASTSVHGYQDHQQGPSPSDRVEAYSRSTRHLAPSHQQSQTRTVTAQDPLPPSLSPGDSTKLTYQGHVKTSTDAILLLAACDLPDSASAVTSGEYRSDAQVSPPSRRIKRRLLESERADLIRPGSIFVWDEEEAGMRRWTDGRCWSASRVSGCFLTYRELQVRKRTTNDGLGPRSNQYKTDGLIKQSFSMTTTSGRKLHIVSYYTKRDARQGRLRRVSEDPRYVGEGGGEWGLEVDEEEFPDPMLTAANNEDEKAAIAQQQPSKGPEQEVQSHKTRALGPALPAAPTMGPSVAGVKRGFDAASPSECSPLPPIAAFQANSSGAAPLPPRPQLKRLRSSSAGASYPAHSNALYDMGRRLSDHTHDGSDRKPMSMMLTESNMRGAGFDAHHPNRADVISPGRRHGGEVEQDNAVGALLSLRSSHSGSFGSNSLYFNDSSRGTPITSPEGSTPGSKDAAGHLMMPKSAELQRPSVTPLRSLSDRDALDKFHLRV